MGSSKPGKPPKPAPVIAPVEQENKEARRTADETRRKYAQTSRQQSNLVQSYSNMATGRRTTGGV